MPARAPNHNCGSCREEPGDEPTDDQDDDRADDVIRHRVADFVPDVLQGVHARSPSFACVAAHVNGDGDARDPR